MKTKINALILAFILTLSALPLSAQKIIIPAISRGDLEQIDEIDETVKSDFRTYYLQNPESDYMAYRDFLKNKAETYDPSKARTYRDKQTYRNRMFMPIITKDDVYSYCPGLNDVPQKEQKEFLKNYDSPNCFQKKGKLFNYAIAARNASLELKTQLSYEDFRNHAQNEMRRMFLGSLETTDENVLKEINLDNKRSPINDASYLAGFYAQNLVFTEAIREANLTWNSSDCQSPESKKDKDCVEASVLGRYNYKLFESANQNVIKHISTIAPMLNRCLGEVLAPLQAKKIVLQEIENYLDEHSDKPWDSCGVDYEEARQLILDNTLTRADAEDIIKNTGFGQKLLKTLDYISFSYYFNRASAIEDFKMGEEDQLEGLSNDKIYHEAQISDLLSNSLNKALTQIASNYITYGQVFYYDAEGFSGESDKFAEGWHSIGTNKMYKDMPIAKLTRDAINRSGRRGYQDKAHNDAMQEIRFENNAESEVQILTLAADFVMDPTMLLAPIGETVKAAELLGVMSAVVAPNATAKVTKAVGTAATGIEKAKTAVESSKLGKTVGGAVKKVKQPIKSVAQKVYDNVADWNFGNHLDDPGVTKMVSQGGDKTSDIAKGIKEGADVTDAAKAADNVADVTTPAAKTTPKKTATDPEELGHKLTDEFDEALEKSKLSLIEKRSSVPERYKDQIDDILEQINKAKADSSLTPDQRRVVDEATEYFNSLTPENLADGNLYNSAKFRENAAKLRSPNATEHGFFIDASGAESSILVEQGYIPHILFSEGDLPFNDIKKMFKGAQKTDKPIFVRLQSHGEIDASGKFYFILGDGESKNVIYTNDLVEALQSLRTTTGTPEINLYSGACHSGQFLDEFIKLPVEQRKGINIFATAGSPLQVNATSNVNLSRIRDASVTIKEDQLDNTIEIIRTKGNIFTRAYVDGEIFDPLGQALLRSKTDPKYAKLTDKLEILNRLHTSTDVKVRDIQLNYQFDAHGEWSPISNSFASVLNVFDTECRATGLDEDVIEFVHETALQMRKGKRW